MIKSSKREKDAELLRLLELAFPECISLDSPKPLAIGIFEQMLHAFDNRLLRRALRVYTSRTRYLYALKEDGAVRVNIDGSDAGSVDNLHKSEAKIRIFKIREAHKRARKQRESQDASKNDLSENTFSKPN